MKTQGHIYLANLLIDDLRKGYIEISQNHTVNRFYPPAVVKNAILKYPASFRAGALGPDVYPDVYFGQAIIHPWSDINSGLWLMIMSEELRNYDMGTVDGQKALAFYMGVMMHYSTDLFTHTFVNKKAGGDPFPRIRINLPKKDQDNIKWHVAVETYSDNKIPLKYKTGEDVRIESPVGFLINCFGKYPKRYLSIVNSRLRAAGDIDEYVKGDSDKDFSSVSPLTYLICWRSYIHEIVEKYKPYRGNILTYPFTTNVAGAFDRWTRSMDKAIAGWILTSDQIAMALTDPNRSMKDAIGLVENWLTDCAVYVLPVPDILIDIFKEVVKILEKTADFLTSFIWPLAELWKNIKQWMKSCVTDLVIMILKHYGIDIREMEEIIKDPRSFMEKRRPGSAASLDKELGNFGRSSDTNDQTFKEFRESLNMAKLCLIGTENLNERIFYKKEPEFRYEIPIGPVYATLVLEDGPAAAVPLTGSLGPASAQIGTVADIASPFALQISEFTFGVELKNGKEHLGTAYLLNSEVNGKRAMSAKVVFPDPVYPADIRRFFIVRSSLYGKFNSNKILNVIIKCAGIPDQDYPFNNNFDNKNRSSFPSSALNFKTEVKIIGGERYNIREFVPMTAFRASDKLTVVIKTANKRWAGTDNDVYFGVELKNGEEFKTVCDEPYVNDFEKGKTGTYLLELPRHIRASEIRCFFIEKKGIVFNDNWEVDWAHVYLGSLDLGGADINKVVKTSSRIRFMDDLNYTDRTANLGIDPKIVAFIRSLDESDQVKRAKFIDHPGFKSIFEPKVVVPYTPPQYHPESGKEYVLERLPEPIAVEITLKYVKNKFDARRTQMCELLLHQDDCASRGALAARLGKFENGGDAYRDALKRGFVNIARCGVCMPPFDGELIIDVPPGKIPSQLPYGATQIRIEIPGDLRISDIMKAELVYPEKLGPVIGVRPGLGNMALEFKDLVLDLKDLEGIKGGTRKR
ncbi:MAG: zinc dependent phospholipase C family protein [Methanomassiliicoccaceae archaeon]|jgi:hypothetical protein|nr:zinc dependent phospholipase C family protein [Methanomassiliicoccaceae archaeon]